MLDERQDKPRRRHPLDIPPGEQRPAQEPRQQPGTTMRRVRLEFAAQRPYVTYVLIAINVIIFVLRALSLDLDIAWLNFGANNGTQVFVDGEYWRLFTSMFLHMSIHDFRGGFAIENSMHLLFNMYALYVIGMTVERVNGHGRFLIIYLLGGLVGSLASALANLGSSVGASGAVFAIFGAEYIFLRQHRDLFGEQGRRQMRSLVTLAIINLLAGFVSQFGTVNIDNWGHIGGAIGGLALSSIAGAHYEVMVQPDTHTFVARDQSDLHQSYVRLGACAFLFVLAVAISTLVFRTF